MKGIGNCYRRLRSRLLRMLLPGLLPFLVGMNAQAVPDASAATLSTVSAEATSVAPLSAVSTEAASAAPNSPVSTEAAGDAQPSRAPVTYSWRRTGVTASAAMSQTASAAPAAGTEQRRDDPVLSWETGAGKGYSIAGYEIATFLVLLSLHDRVFLSDERNKDGSKTYSSTFSSTWDHIRRQNWEIDSDPFNVNQFGHPYQGATMYGLARSAGLDFWESALYANLGSFAWEMAGETGPPSINDIATTGTSGSLLGEALFRMWSLVLRDKGDGPPDGWHELGAAVVSPPASFNRYVFGDRFRTPFPSHDPATFWRFRLGASLSGNSQQAATADFAMSYGLPGKPGYSYDRPLDYFDFQIAGLSSSSNRVSMVFLRGLLYGKPYGIGDDYRGIWGLYGNYDYLSPGSFRVSNTALSLGSTGQYWLAPGIALQGSLLGGVGFGAAGVSPTSDGDRDYHYGVTPEVMLALKLILGDRVALDAVGRGYYVTGAGPDEVSGSERIGRATVNLNFRVWKRHGLGLQYVRSVRDARYLNHASKRQSDDTVSLVYTFLGSANLGAVEWRNLGDR